MKKVILLFLFLTGIALWGNAQTTESANKRMRDSIFHKADSMPEDSLRSQYLRIAFQQYIGQESATEYLDSALTLCIRKKLNHEELWVLFDYCRQYEYRAELSNEEQALVRLKEASYRYKEYSFYYTIWLSILQAHCAHGNTEYAIIQAKEMKTEAARLNYDNGMFIASLALAQAYDFAGRNKEAIATYQQTLDESPQANDAALEMIHGSLAKNYQKLKMYPQALSALQHQLDAVKRSAKNMTSSDLYKTAFLGIEISFCNIYMQIKDNENFILHLKNAQKYYNKDTYLGNYIDYHALWGGYYKLSKEWDKCFHEFDLALSACRGIDPFNENRILGMQAAALMEAGHYQKAAEAYRKAAIRGDSLNQVILQRHEDAHQANYKIQKALLEKEQLTKRYRFIQVAAATIVLIILIFFIVRAFLIRRQLQNSEDETRRAFETMKAADKMKECFLHNITYEIRVPLNTVVGFSELLSSENDLTDEDITEYSAAVKNNSTKLLSLINNILDLSRLEAAMMKFNVQEDDIVQLCQEAKMMVKAETPDAVELVFNTELENLYFAIDSKWFLKLLLSLLAVPKDYTGDTRKIEYTLSKENGNLKIIIKNSPLYQFWEDEQEQHILHDINRLCVETFKGSYQVSKEGKEDGTLVTITYPIG